MQHAPLQFSLKSMLAVTTAVALLCALFSSVSVDDRLTLVALTDTAILFAVIMLATVCEGYAKAFGVGALVPAVLSYFVMGEVYAGLFGLQRHLPEIRPNLAAYATVTVTAIVFGGAVGVFVQWLVQSLSSFGKEP